MEAALLGLGVGNLLASATPGPNTLLVAALAAHRGVGVALAAVGGILAGAALRAAAALGALVGLADLGAVDMVAARRRDGLALVFFLGVFPQVLPARTTAPAEAPLGVAAILLSSAVGLAPYLAAGTAPPTPGTRRLPGRGAGLAIAAGGGVALPSPATV